MEAPRAYHVDARGRDCRILEKGDGPSLYWLGSAPALYRWTYIHEALADHFHVKLCSLPGMPGNGRNHVGLNAHLDWCLAAHDILQAAGFAQGDILMGSSTAGALAADVAALWPERVTRLVLVAPHGLFDSADPTRDIFALSPNKAAALLSEKPDAFRAQTAKPDDVPQVEWTIILSRADEAMARYLWPLGNTRLASRLDRITARTLLLWGDADKIIPPGYAKRFAHGLSGAAEVQIIAGAGHALEIDAPHAAAEAIIAFAQAL